MTFLISIIGTFLGISLFYFLKRKRQVLATKGECSICGHIFPDQQLLLSEELAFCEKDFKVFKNKKWREAKRVLSDPENPEESLRIYKEKKELTEQGVHCFIKVEYVEDRGVIQSIFKLYQPTETNT